MTQHIRPRDNSIRAFRQSPAANRPLLCQLGLHAGDYIREEDWHKSFDNTVCKRCGYTWLDLDKYCAGGGQWYINSNYKQEGN